MMKTKIVYVVASHSDDIYMEQAIVSAWSARHYNPDCHIEMVCCQDTFATFGSGIRAQYKTLFDQIHVREFQSEQSMMERSRWMKTTLREIIEGDYLYLDTDTVVCADLSYVDNFDFELGMVLDGNIGLKQSIFKEWVITQMQEIYNIDVSDETQYFNSGVVFVRDCKLTHRFYKLWNEQWIYSFSHFNKIRDQQPLMRVDMEMGRVIKEMPGDLNCQVIESIQYLHTAHIVHFFNNYFCKSDEMTPFFKEIFLRLKISGLTDSIKESIINCKSSFCSPSMLIPVEAAMLLYKIWNPNRIENKINASNSFRVISFVWLRFPKLMQFVETGLGVLIRMSQLRKCL